MQTSFSTKNWEEKPSSQLRYLARLPIGRTMMIPMTATTEQRAALRELITTNHSPATKLQSSQPVRLCWLMAAKRPRCRSISKQVLTKFPIKVMWQSLKCLCKGRRPTRVTHSLTLRKTTANQMVSVHQGQFSPRAAATIKKMSVLSKTIARRRSSQWTRQKRQSKSWPIGKKESRRRMN